MKSYEITKEKAHNLEVLGSSPSWSTLKIKQLRNYVTAFFFVGVNRRFECLLFHIRKVRLGGDELFVADVHVEDDSGSARFCDFQNLVFFCGIVCVEADEHIHYV